MPLHVPPPADPGAAALLALASSAPPAAPAPAASAPPPPTQPGGFRSGGGADGSLADIFGGRATNQLDRFRQRVRRHDGGSSASATSAPVAKSVANDENAAPLPSLLAQAQATVGCQRNQEIDDRFAAKEIADHFAAEEIATGPNASAAPAPDETTDINAWALAAYGDDGVESSLSTSDSTTNAESRQDAMGLRLDKWIAERRVHLAKRNLADLKLEVLDKVILAPFAAGEKEDYEFNPDGSDDHKLGLWRTPHNVKGRVKPFSTAQPGTISNNLGTFQGLLRRRLGDYSFSFNSEKNPYWKVNGRTCERTCERTHSSSYTASRDLRPPTPPHPP